MRAVTESGDRPVRAGVGAASRQAPTALQRLSALALHPFLFAAASVLRLFATNLNELYLSDAALSLAAALGAALVFYLAFRALVGSRNGKAAILASATLLAGVFYGEIVDAANKYLGLGLSEIGALPVVLAILAVLSFVIMRTRADFNPANVVLNCIAFVLFIVPAWRMAEHEWMAGNFQAALGQPAGRPPAGNAADPVADPALAKDAPDIFYFIFDRYGSQSNLAQYYGFDNAELMAFLKEKGFYVAAESSANYLKTAHSLASTFHLDYLDFLREDRRSKIIDWHPIFDMLREHRVGRFLKSNGYEFIQIGSWWGQTQHNPYADENYSFGFGEFDNRYLRKTVVPALLETVAPASSYTRSLLWENGQCQRVPKQIEKVKEIAERKERTFVFAHILVPHDPYVFSPDGRCLSYQEAMRRTERDGYVEQVRYANSLIKDFVSAVLAKGRPKPIIIIQADEGPFPKRYRHSNLSWRKATMDEIKTKMGILNAYYFPDGDYRDLDQQITSVNTFRVVFNKYFGTKLERLPDRNFAFPDYFTIYDFYDITDTVHAARARQ